MTEDTARYGRRVTNVTAAFPHANLFAAAQDPINNIMQPNDLGGLGGYSIIASVPSPTINVMCAAMTADELSPLIYTSWPGSNGTFNDSTWSTFPPEGVWRFPSYGNKTVVDDLFDFGEAAQQRPPVFPKLPAPLNTLVNGTGDWPSYSVYVLGNNPVADPPYSLCAVRSMQYPMCSSRYRTSGSGGVMEAHCEDKDDAFSYHRHHPEAPSGKWDPDWKNIASEWANSLSLGSGISDANASITRALTDLIPTHDYLEPSLPSLAESLVVLAGETAMLASQDAPFIHFWNYSSDVVSLADPQYQQFPAKLQTQDYASGGVQQWQGMFYVILIAIFAMNLFVLGYLIIRGGQVTDYTEPQNLFALAVNSPASGALAGSCGAGPQREQFAVEWKVHMENEHLFFQEKGGMDNEGIGKRAMSPSPTVRTQQFQSEESPIVNTYARLSGRRRTRL